MSKTIAGETRLFVCPPKSGGQKKRAIMGYQKGGDYEYYSSNELRRENGAS